MSALLAAGLAWSFMQTRDPISDAYQAEAALGSGGIDLVVQCEEVDRRRALIVGMRTPEYLGEDQFRRVEFRFDDQPGESTAWTYRPHFAFDADQRETRNFARRIAGARSLTIRLFARSESLPAVTYRLPSDPSGLRSLLSSCE